MDARLLVALRAVRAVGADARRDRLAESLLDVVLDAVNGERATLRLPTVPDELVVGSVASETVARLESSWPVGVGAAGTLIVERVAPAFTDEDASLVEVLGGEVLLRLENHHIEAESARRSRQLEFLQALTRGGIGVLRVSDLAAKAAREILEAFSGAQVAVHVVVDDDLVLAALRRDTGDVALENTSLEFRRSPVAGVTLQATAASELRAVSQVVSTLPDCARKALEPLGLRHVMAVPLVFSQRLVGTLSIAHREESVWNAEELLLLESAAAQIAMALAHARLFEEERSRAEDFATINELGSLIAQHPELSSVLATAVTYLAQIAEVPRVHVMLVDESRTALYRAASNLNEDVDVRFPLDEPSAVAEAFHTLRPIFIVSAQNDERASMEAVNAFGTRSILAIPLVSRGDPIGVIALVESRHERKFTQFEMDRAVAIANLVSPAIANAKMFEDLRRSYEALARTQAELVTHERLAALGELSAVMAHEVRNPVAIIFNSIGNLRRLIKPAPDATLLLDIVGQEAQRLNRIVGDLLDFAKPYALNPRPEQLSVLVHAAVEAARRAAPEAPARIEADLFCQPDEMVVLDGAMFQQALINLIVNAVQAMPKGGTVTVRAGCEGADDASTLRCEVTDEGAGVAPGDEMRIFQPFFTTKATGTGLGLAVVKRIADALHGAVEVTRAPSGGAVFTLTVPLFD
jgi:signal transduction histidine kinase